MSSARVLAFTCPSVINGAWLHGSGACVLTVLNLWFKMPDHVVLTSIAIGSTAGCNVFDACQKFHTHSISFPNIIDV